MDETNNINVDWLDEKVTKIDGHKFLYNFICFFTFRMRRKIRYKDLFLVYYGVHRKNLGEENAKKKALNSVLKVYKENNNKLPDGI